jgi:antitoxin HicB
MRQRNLHLRPRGEKAGLPYHRRSIAADPGVGVRFGENGWMTFKKGYFGASLEDWLEEEGILQEATASAAKKAIAQWLSEEMRRNKITKMRMAELMETSRAQLELVLETKSSNTTLETLRRAAKIAGRELLVELV